MQKLTLKQHLTQKLSPQQIQFIKLLEVPSTDMTARIEEEVIRNPALEKEEPEQNETSTTPEETAKEAHWEYETTLIPKSYRLDRKTLPIIPITVPPSLHEQLTDQLNCLTLNEQAYKIGQQIIGSITPNGYLPLDLATIVNDLAFTQYIETNTLAVEAILKKIQTFDPPGIGARDLQECLLIQLKRKKKQDKVHQLALQIITDCFQAFTKKHYHTIMRKLKIKHAQRLKEALALITTLNPQPGYSIGTMPNHQVLHPDFIVTQQQGSLEVYLTPASSPSLKVRKQYTNLFQSYDKHPTKDQRIKETTTFLKQKLTDAQWFIDAIKQRQQTLLRIMKAIVRLQSAFFEEGEENTLQPMILKDIAKDIHMDVSTISRVVSNKSVQTDFGIYPLKFFFSEAVIATTGEEVSNRTVKRHIRDIIAQEDKQKPYPDETLTLLLKEKGYFVARRTVAKYREQLNIPVARLRKEL